MEIQRRLNPPLLLFMWVILLTTDIHIFFGLGDGRAVYELLTTNEKAKAIIIEPLDVYGTYEPDEQLFMDGRATLHFCDCGGAMAQVLMKEVDWSEYENVSFQILPYYMKNRLSNVKDFLEAFRNMMIIKPIERNTGLAYSRLWHTNYIKNLSALFRAVPHKAFSGAFEGVPAILVCAGPSLDKNMFRLKAAKGKALIIAAYTALKPLLDNGILPDFVFSIDGMQLRLEDDSEIDAPLHIPLVYTMQTDARLLKRARGSLVRVGASMDLIFPLNFLDEEEILNSGGSVACTMLDFVHMAGCDPIVFVGQDLAFTDGLSHMSGTTYDKYNRDPKAVEHCPIMVDGINGEKLQSSNLLYSYLLWIEGFIAAKPPRYYIDATEGGAKITGTEVMTLKETINLFVQNDENILKRLNACFASKTVLTEEERPGLLALLHLAEKELRIYVEDSKRAIEDINKLIEITGSGNVDEHELAVIHERLNAFDAKLRTESVSRRLIQLPLNRTAYDLEHYKPNGESEEAATLNKSKMLYEGVNDAVILTLDLVTEAISEIEE